MIKDVYVCVKLYMFILCDIDNKIKSLKFLGGMEGFFKRVFCWILNFVFVFYWLSVNYCMCGFRVGRDFEIIFFYENLNLLNLY